MAFYFFVTPSGMEETQRIFEPISGDRFNAVGDLEAEISRLGAAAEGVAEAKLSYREPFDESDSPDIVVLFEDGSNDEVVCTCHPADDEDAAS